MITTRDILSLVNGLKSKDDKYAYGYLKQLEDESNHTSGVYPFIDIFIEMLADSNSYIRTRGIILLPMLDGIPIIKLMKL